MANLLDGDRMEEIATPARRRGNGPAAWSAADQRR